MPTFKLNGQEIPFESGDSIIRAAWRQGIEIPHYCWHPGLSVAANCRMCLVEIKTDRPMALPILRWDEAKQAYVNATKPKLQPACQMLASEGMEVLSKSEQAVEAQASVQEFLLLNHPVDCPICDQAGECKLQDYWLDHQAQLKRKLTEPVHKPKAVRFGPTIVYDAERCIMCTRCIRVCDELVGDHVLDMRERGNRNEITVSPDRQLDHDYTLMTEHVCPVGALTSRDFRFKARVWFLRAVPSVCNGCATGCNSFMDFDPRYNRVERLRPRDNEAVNKFWMCDDGMMSYKRLYEGRVLSAHVRKPSNFSASSSVSSGVGTAPPERVQSVHAVRLAAEQLRDIDGSKVGLVLSAQHSNEDNFALLEFARRIFKTERLYLAALGGWRPDDILRHSDNNPNRAGVTWVAGRTLLGVGQLLEDVKAGRVATVIALGSAAEQGVSDLQPLLQLTAVIVLSSHQGSFASVASALIPVAAHGEADGTFVNAKGTAQSFKRAVFPPAGILPAWETLGALARALGHEAGPLANLTSLRAALSASKPKHSVPPPSLDRTAHA